MGNQRGCGPERYPRKMKLSLPSEGGGRLSPGQLVTNGRALQEAAVHVIATRGWDATTTVRIAEAAGLTHGAVYARFTNKSNLGAALWTSLLFPQLQELLTAAWLEATKGSPESFAAAMMKFFDPSEATIASVELLAAARFDPILAHAALPITSQLLTTWCRPNPSHSAAKATASAAIAYLAFGLVLGHQRPWRKQSKPRAMFNRFFTAIQYPSRSKRLPPCTADYLRVPPFDTGDSSVDRLLEATAQTVGEFGYNAASVARICRNAHVSQGFLFRRYPTKFDLFLAAADESHHRGISGSQQFLEEIRQRTDASIAEAVTWRELQRPDLALKRSTALEIARLCQFNHRMRAIIHKVESTLARQRISEAESTGARRSELLGHFHMDVALGLGVLIVPILLPDVWTLPFDSFTTPLLENDPWASSLT